MAFKSANLTRLAKFNSAASSHFIDMYEEFVDSKIAAQNAEPKHKTFAPSSMRCPRISWFRLRGVQPDKIEKPDRTLQFTADIGSACHEIIQRNLTEALGASWISVEDYLKQIDFPYEYTLTQNGFETQIEINSPPIRFACDGIIFWEGKYYLLEIKTSEFSSFDELTNPKAQHEDQIKVYLTLLKLDQALVLYQDRQYGGLKCYEVHITERQREEVKSHMEYVMHMAECNLAPERLDRNDSWCTPTHCPYYRKCKEWG